MPVERCVKEGKPGHKWGGQGVCFVGSNSKEQAAKVGQAIKAKENVKS